MMKKALFLMILFTFLTASSEARDDFQYWSQYSIKMYDGEKIDWFSYADLRVEQDASKLGVYLFSQKLKMDFFKHLSLGLNYTYLSSRNTTPGVMRDDYNWQHRLELEANPGWMINDILKFDIRNRYEFRWIEDKGNSDDRFRHRWMLTLPLKTNTRIKSIYCSSEGFYDLAADTYSENRTVPFGINFALNEKVSLNTYYMVRWKKGSRDWSSNQVLGSMLSWVF